MTGRARITQNREALVCALIGGARGESDPGPHDCQFQEDRLLRTVACYVVEKNRAAVPLRPLDAVTHCLLCGQACCQRRDHKRVTTREADVKRSKHTLSTHS